MNRPCRTQHTSRRRTSTTSKFSQKKKSSTFILCCVSRLCCERCCNVCVETVKGGETLPVSLLVRFSTGWLVTKNQRSQHASLFIRPLINAAAIKHQCWLLPRSSNNLFTCRSVNCWMVPALTWNIAWADLPQTRRPFTHPIKE